VVAAFPTLNSILSLREGEEVALTMNQWLLDDGFVWSAKITGRVRV